LVKREWSPALIEVKVKVEDRDDELKHVFFTKSEDGMLDIWNLDGFGLGLEIQVAELFNKGWTRKEISDVTQIQCHHSGAFADPFTFLRLWVAGIKPVFIIGIVTLLSPKRR
jgi:hypothetical protein